MHLEQKVSEKQSEKMTLRDAFQEYAAILRAPIFCDKISTGCFAGLAAGHRASGSGFMSTSVQTLPSACFTAIFPMRCRWSWSVTGITQ